MAVILFLKAKIPGGAAADLFSAPVMRPASLTTMTLVMRCCSIRPAASTARAS